MKFLSLEEIRGLHRDSCFKYDIDKNINISVDLLMLHTQRTCRIIVPALNFFNESIQLALNYF